MHATCATINVTSLAFGLPYVQQLVIPTRLTFLGHLHEFVPLAPLRMPGTAELPTPTLDKCERWAANENTRWRKTTTLARTGQRMRLVVLGTSVTAGCGSAEDVVQGKMYGAGRQHNRSVGLSQFCEPMRSWGRHLRDFLVRQLGSDWAPEVEISPKNAVAADWFARCTSSRVPYETNIVLLEVLPNVWGSDLVLLVRAVRRAAPNATVTFLMWPHVHGIPNPNLYSDRTNMIKTADAEGVDTVDVASIINEIWKHWREEGTPQPNSRESFFRSFYSRGGGDMVHPNPPTHQLLGAVAARYVARRLVDADAAACATEASDRNNLERGPRVRKHASGAGGVGSPERRLSDRIDPSRFEKCYDSADIIPVDAAHNGFELVNEGGDKGVPKMGYRSHRLGDTMLLGPLPLQSGRECLMLVVTVGYLLSATHPNQGAFTVTCVGCKCTTVKSFFQPELFPFPLVQTRLSDASVNWKMANISITGTTEFLALVHSDSKCVVKLLHVASASAHQWENSTIRIDSLSVATCLEKRHLNLNCSDLKTRNAASTQKHQN